MKTTFILGAGASIHAGYPLAADMGIRLLDWMKTPRESVYYDYPGNATYLENRFGNNIEDMVNGIERTLLRHGSDFELMASLYKPSLLQAIREWFAEIQRHNPAVAYRKFASQIIQRGDVVITFNYDVSLDAQLCRAGKWSLGDGYGFRVEGFPMHSPVRLLKLHGSANWLTKVLAGGRPAIPDDDVRALGYEGGLIDSEWPRNGAPAVLPMILPTKRKQFYFATNLGRVWEPFWTRLWRAARYAIRTSERIVICGYGLPLADTRGRNLLLRGEAKGEIEVSSGGRSADIVIELRACGRTARVAQCGRFEEWVNSGDNLTTADPVSSNYD
jgi:hypothetical protein